MLTPAGKPSELFWSGDDDTWGEVSVSSEKNGADTCWEIPELSKWDGADTLGKVSELFQSGDVDTQKKDSGLFFQWPLEYLHASLTYN